MALRPQLRWFNQLEFLDDAAVKERYPGIHQLIHQVADDYRFKAPKIGFIPDRNPTAFTYGPMRSSWSLATRTYLISLSILPNALSLALFLPLRLRLSRKLWS